MKRKRLLLGFPQQVDPVDSGLDCGLTSFELKAHRRPQHLLSPEWLLAHLGETVPETIVAMAHRVVLWLQVPAEVAAMAYSLGLVAVLLCQSNSATCPAVQRFGLCLSPTRQ